MDRKNSLELIGKYVKNKNLIKHMIATEAVMKRYARELGEDEALWGAAGLVHDIDVELTRDDAGLHGKKGAEILRQNGYPENLVEAVVNHTKSAPCGDRMSRLLFSADQVTGLIVASALIHPDKKLASIDRDFVVKRFHEKRFAAGVKRENIKAVEETGIAMDDFIGKSLEAMAAVSNEIGL